MAQDVEMPRIANASTDPKEHEAIEVTAEMIEAGCAELAAFDNRYEAEEEAVERIYRAMAILTSAASSYGRGKKPKRRS
jgi:hypothetical protein